MMLGDTQKKGFYHLDSVVLMNSTTNLQVPETQILIFQNIWINYILKYSSLNLELHALENLIKTEAIRAVHGDFRQKQQRSNNKTEPCTCVKKQRLFL